MVPVIGDLVVHLSRFRIHLVQPFQPPVDLIDNVRNPVAPREAVGFVIVRECRRTHHVGEHHLVDGVGGSRGVLQAVRSVMPSSDDIKMGAVLGGIRMADYYSIMGVATVPERRIPPATLLPHVIEHEIGRTVIHSVIDWEYA